MPRVTKYDENDEPIAGYRLVSFLGAGQFGEVWKANEETTRKLVAIKIIDLSHSNSALKELKALNLVINLNHPNLIPIFTARLKDKNGREIPLHKTDELKQKGALRELVIAMGLGDKSLSSRLKELNPDGTDPADFKGLPVDELLGYMQGAAKGIDFLNKENHGISGADGSIVHCDIKPDNMMIVSGEVQIADCGVAVIITPDVRQTKAAGSPAYSAPELTGNKPVPGTDQYALAISYYEMRTGKLPFDEQMGQLSIMLAHAEGRLDFTSPMLTDEEVKVLKWATAVRPKERYATCLDMVKQLERAIEGLPPLEPSKVGGLRSGVVPTSRSRAVPAAPPPLDPAMLRSTPNLPKPPSQETKKKSDPSVSFDVTERDELRGTVIPDSDRYFQPNGPGMSLPAPPARGGPPAAVDYGASQSDIVMPTEAEDLFSDEEFSNTNADPVPPQLDARAPGTGIEKSSPNWDVSRPQISVDGDDPMGARAGTVELDPEIAKIIKGGGGAKQPAMRLPAPTSAPAVQTQRPPSRPDIGPAAVPNKRSTEFPRETPAEEEAKSLPPWAKEAKAVPPLGKEEESLPTWAKEAKAVEQRTNRAASQSSVATTNWKEPDTAKSGGGMGAKLLVGGVLACGLAAGGAYFGGLLGGSGGSSQAQKVDPDKPPDNTENGGKKKEGTDPVAEVKVDATRVAAIETLIDLKTIPDFDAAQAKIKQLPAEKIYDAERLRLEKRLGDARATFDLALDDEVKTINKIINSVDTNADPVEEGKKIAEAERKIKLLPSTLPTRHVDLRTDWSKRIGDLHVKMNGTVGEREFLAALADLEGRSKEAFTAQLKIVYDKYTQSKQQKQLGQKLVAIGEKKVDYRDQIVAFLTEKDTDRFLLLLPEDTDRGPVFKWRTAQLDAMAAELRAMLESLAKGSHAKDSPAIQAALSKLEELKARRKAVAEEFGNFWNEKYIAKELTDFTGLATVWYDARKGRGEGIKPLRELVQVAVPPDLAHAMAMEYQRIGAEKSESVANLRAAHNASKKWTNLKADEKEAINALFQSALAVRVRSELTVQAAPNWKDIVENTCLDDPAHGWKLAAETEWKLKPGSPIGDLTAAESTVDETQADRKAFIAYLKAVAKNDAASADDLLALYKSPPAIFNAPFRVKLAAEILGKNSIEPQSAIKRPEDILVGTWKPYSSNDKALARLVLADKLDGANHPEWAVHLYLLAAATGNADAKKAVANRASLDEAKLKKVEDLPFAMAYFHGRALDTAETPGSRVAAYAATARLAYRLMEATFEPKEDAKVREAALLPTIAAFAKEGLDLSAGSEADRLSLRLSVFREKLMTTVVFTAKWLDANKSEIESIAKELPNDHPDYADARAYRAFVTLMRFSNTYGDLNKAKATEPDRIKAWDGLIADAEAALRIDPDNDYANRTLGTALLGTFNDYTPVYVPPESLRTAEFRNRDTVLKTDGHLKRATVALKTRKQPFIWRMRSVFLFQAANELAKAGDAQADVRTMLKDAALSAQKSDDQRDDGQKTIDDPLLLGRILEDLAWLGQDRPVENYKAAIEAYNLASTRPKPTFDQCAQNVRGRVDLARTIVRSVQFGHVPSARLTEADAALDAMKADIEKLPEAEMQSPGVKIEWAKGIYWKGIRQLVAGDAAAAEKTLADATNAIRPYAADMYAFSLVHRAEAAIDGKLTTAGTILQDSVEKLRLVLDADGANAIRNTLAFAPDYLLARKALEENKGGTAKTHFAAAYDKIKRAKNARTLLVEDSFVVRCLAHEIKNVNLNANDLKARKDLLVELERAFSWSLTPADKVLVAAAKAR